MKLFTMGFTKKSAEQFFALLHQPSLVRVVDVRLNNVSQLAGFTKRDDLAYLLREVAHLEYAHLPVLAPTQELLNAYKKDGGDWATYQSRFLDLIAERRIETALDRTLLDGACLLCSEPTPHRCHRRLVAEYLADKWGNVEIQHL
ncbi:MAG: DUF488 family protein [Planctomycetaceae bacterium]|nr:DUF488 family protein [Planctomycetaceae bacterium]